MVDDATWAGILKTDGRGRDLVGAVLQVKDKSGNVIEEWTTDGTRHEMRAVLNPDETYILHEVSAPEGYFLSEDLEFTAGQRVIMEDIKQTDLTVGKLSDIQEQIAGQNIIFCRVQCFRSWIRTIMCWTSGLPRMHSTSSARF